MKMCEQILSKKTVLQHNSNSLKCKKVERLNKSHWRGRRRPLITNMMYYTVIYYNGFTSNSIYQLV